MDSVSDPARGVRREAFTAPLIGRRTFLALAALPFLAFLNEAQAIDVKGVTYVSVADLASACGMKFKTVVAKKRQSVYGAYTTMYFDVHQRCMTINGIKAWMGFPVVEGSGMLYIARSDFLKTIQPILFPQKFAPAPRLTHIVLDPGHGGKDNGAQNKAYGLYEKIVTLDLAFRLGRMLKARGYRVSYTRTKDVFVDLDDRVRIANNLKANLFISLHFNAAAPSADGLETYALTPAGQSSTNAAVSSGGSAALGGNRFDPWNALLAYYNQMQICAATGLADRGLRRARFYVLKDIAMPAMLVEGGFISNRSDAARIRSGDYREKLATGISAGVAKYQSTLNRLK